MRKKQVGKNKTERQTERQTERREKRQRQRQRDEMREREREIVITEKVDQKHRVSAQNDYEGNKEVALKDISPRFFHIKTCLHSTNPIYKLVPNLLYSYLTYLASIITYTAHLPIPQLVLPSIGILSLPKEPLFKLTCS